MSNILNNDRFKGLDWVSDRYESALIAGAGGISSWLAVLLARIGTPTRIVDFDTVEPHNLGGQLFNPDKVGHLKVSAVIDMLHYTTQHPNCVSDPNRITSNYLQRYCNRNQFKYIFSGVDNIECRKLLAEEFLINRKNENRNQSNVLIDGRLLAETFQIYVVTDENVHQYMEEAIFDDDISDTLPCTAKQTSHIAAMIGSMMTGYYTNILFNRKIGMNIRDVPFFTSYDLSSNVLQTVGQTNVVRENLIRNIDSEHKFEGITMTEESKESIEENVESLERDNNVSCSNGIF